MASLPSTASITEVRSGSSILRSERRTDGSSSTMSTVAPSGIWKHVVSVSATGSPPEGSDQSRVVRWTNEDLRQHSRTLRRRAHRLIERSRELRDRLRSVRKPPPAQRVSLTPTRKK